MTWLMAAAMVTAGLCWMKARRRRKAATASQDPYSPLPDWYAP